ncbi:hypothetical protein RchiOBHm_Chr7g0208871 [Rosa chinensis]|uniref:Uncharacterized protein n=1 Tax=Rosa chinensis TaxID=74649 RepID=A0A2P6P9U2_ROSCH|nr:uncharacterized protein LOC112177693 [Rosa chinensis]PRQ18693.1 hypothetical protein RchiOBHm_Chr7g0208871 [Rosa chinensis]
MKISLRLQDDQDTQHYCNPLIRAKIPITIFNQPFTSSIATAPSTNSSSHLSFSLSSNFSSGPSLKLSYSHASTTTPSPFSLSLKSGLGLFGSPNHSPLVFTAHFSLSHTNPTFSLHIKPQFGNFSLNKSAFSDSELSGSCSNGDLDSGSCSNGGFVDGFVVSEGSSSWQELSLEPRGGKDVNGGIGSVEERQLGLKNGGKDGFLNGIAVMARTVLPVTKRVMVNMRWGVNFPAKLGTKLPYLTVNKIAVETVEEVKGEEEKSGESSVKDLELLKGMWLWMRRDLEVLDKENRDMKQRLEDMKSGVSGRHFRGESDASRKRVLPPLGETSGEFERWRNKKGGREENVRTESHTPVKSVREESIRVDSKKSTNQASDLESELERAIKAATA